ncbi:hypothetical protein JLK41_19695 [Ectopseudomonas khazarica]|uniref:hypothetical protein n=1 Tax=Ectopseudomonas khazarica TaxID=2502979 RepID=UPI001AEF5E8F|nr:hypothetical protein [Pseudomonas khazarica]QTS85525.1 hypothetical protein JLK41_19695 [Pseudomonas khazarica]
MQMLYIRSIATAMIMFPLMATAETGSPIERQLHFMEGATKSLEVPKRRPRLFGRLAESANARSGNISIGKVITYDLVNYAPYNGTPTDYSTLNIVFMGFSSSSPVFGSATTELDPISNILFARMAKPNSNAATPEQGLICNLSVTSQTLVQAVVIDGVNLPLSFAYDASASEKTYSVIVPTGYSQAESQLYYQQQHAFCTTFESFNSTYPNGASVQVTLVP